MVQSNAEMLEFLRTHVYKDGDCRLWAGAFTRNGYPKVQWNHRYYSARRLMLTLTGKHVCGRVVLVTCGDNRCMAEAHMKTISRAEFNTRHLGKHGGASHSMAVAIGRAPRAKMPMTKAREVSGLRAQGMTYAQIGAVYGVTKSAVGHALQTWARAGVL